MQNEVNLNNINEMDINNYQYKYIDIQEIKKISDKTLLQRVEKTYDFLKLCEAYHHNVKDDYSKKKIASLRVDIVKYQLELLIRECFVRGLKHGLKMI